MDRPSPLPTPPAAERRAPAPAQEARPSASVRPDDPAPSRPAVAPADRAVPRETPVDPETDATGTSLRDVWRASRARRRALRAEVKRFTVRQRRRRRVWIGVGVAVLVTVLGTAGAAYSPLFALERVEVVGTSQLDAVAVTAALDDQLGTPLALVDDSAVKAALVRFPLVESYTLEARPPHDLVVRIVERTPVGAIESDGVFTVVDAAGVALSTSSQAPPGVPLLRVDGGADSTAFRAAGRVVRALPDGIRSQVAEVTATTADDVAFTLTGSGSRVVWGSADESAEKAVVLNLLLQKSPPQAGREYDVTSPEAGVVRG
ncbi:MAG: FtsQ-type POTRA domain-containing protein [Actinobacteria bacterium]|nr:FtsQ-type POTRA domain-containing protein [Actinomycetota bacterium]